MSDRDKFLTEAMGEFYDVNGFKTSCPNCYRNMNHNPDFSTWDGFGKLWEWAKGQEWFCLMMAHNGCGPHDIVNPDLFANEVYKFLKQEADKP